jgi:hypothetical protein
MDTEDKHSPLRRPPLRQAGQSLQEEINQLMEDKVLEWANVLFKLPRQPWLYTAILAGFAVYAFIKLRPVYARLQQLKLGRDGERTVGQELEKLRADGYRIYHDFIVKPANREPFNIDHIVIGPTGVFTVETKTYSKPKGQDVSIGYDGRVVNVPGLKLDCDPITQAKAQGDYLRAWIKENANRMPPIRAAVVFVGWFTQRQPEGADVWVLNTTGLMSFIKHARTELSEDDIVHIASILEIHSRN